MTGEPESLPPPGRAARLAARLGLERAVVFLLLRQAWRLAAGVVTVVVIARAFTPAVQGYYYTFSSLLGLQSIAELGLYLVVMNVASHEWAGLRLGVGGRIEGEAPARARLASLARFTLSWYAAAAALFGVGAAVAGLVFFSRSPGDVAGWEGPWLGVVGLTSLLFVCTPFLSLLEGCGQVEAVSRMRLLEAVLTSVVLWAAMLGGAGLWAILGATAVSFSCSALLLLVGYRGFFASLRATSAAAAIRWRTEIWPLQWRLAVQGLVGFLLFSLFTPVLFHYHGAAEAGRMGMTWQATTAIGAAAITWIHVRASRLGVLAARGDFAGLHRLWLSAARISTGILLLGGAGLLLLLAGLRAAGVDLAARFLPLLPTSLLLAGTLATHAIQCLAYYLRAHKREPLLASGVLSSLACGVLVWVLGRRFGATGAASAYAIATGLVALPLTTFIWLRCRAAWHGGTSPCA